MKMSLQTYFDLGVTYGLNDDVFRPSSDRRFRAFYDATLQPKKEYGPDRDRHDTSVVNPLGNGVICPLMDDADGRAVLKVWKEAALELVGNKDIEFGSPITLDSDVEKQARHATMRPEGGMALRDRVRALIESSSWPEGGEKKIPGRGPRIVRAELVIYAIGTVFLRMDVDFQEAMEVDAEEAGDDSGRAGAQGVSPNLAELPGFYECWEHAIYLEEVSGLLRAAARKTAEDWVVYARQTAVGWAAYAWRMAKELRASAPLTADEYEKKKAQERVTEAAACRWSVATRPEPSTCVVGKDDRQRIESTLIRSVTCVMILNGDREGSADVDLEMVKQAMRSVQDAKDYKRLKFDYHGTMHFGWAACLMEPRPAGEQQDDPEVEMEGALDCLQTALVFLGTREAFERLFETEALQQAKVFILGMQPNRTERELNRLRVLALGMLDRTRYLSVSASDEVQKCFQKFESHAKLNEIGEHIESRCQILHDIRVDETLAKEQSRGRFLNLIVLILSGLTILSVASDGYNFIRNQEDLIPILLTRLGVLLAFSIAILSSLYALWCLADRRQ